MTELGEFVGELKLKGENGEELKPSEMFFNSSKILGVNCRGEEREEHLIFLERKKFSCFLQIIKIIETTSDFGSFSVCKNHEKILFCNSERFQFDFYTEKGEFIKTIDTGVETGRWRTHRIRADPSTGKIWGATQGTREIFSFNKKGTNIHSAETKEEILDFLINEVGQFFFSNYEGIFTFFPEKELHQNLFKFEKKSKYDPPKLFISREKLFVCLKVDRKYLIKIFKFLD